MSPILTGQGPNESRIDRISAFKTSGSAGWLDSKTRGDWTVRAVAAENPMTPREPKVLRSAVNPAKPHGSTPAIVRAWAGNNCDDIFRTCSHKKNKILSNLRMVSNKLHTLGRFLDKKTRKRLEFFKRIRRRFRRTEEAAGIDRHEVPKDFLKEQRTLGIQPPALA